MTWINLGISGGDSFGGHVRQSHVACLLLFILLLPFLSTFLSVCGDLLCLALDLESQSVEALLFGNSKTFAMARNTSRPPFRLVFRNSNIYNSKSSLPLFNTMLYFS